MGELLFDKYEKIKQLGQGGYGEVFLARDIHLDKLCAIKFMEKKDDTESEAKLLKELKHDGLPLIYDYRELPDKSLIVMEYVDGISLRSYLDKRGTVPLGKALEWMNELMDIIGYLHASRQSVIYRDLKPSNIMITGSGHIKLIDFGAAFVKDYSGKSREGSYGTDGYSAPELFKGRIAKESADIYSLGAVFHEMLSGMCPSGGSYKRLPVRQYDKSCPKGIERIIEKCLREEDARYQSIEALRQDINGYKRLGVNEEIMKLVRVFIIAAAYVTALTSLYLAYVNAGYDILSAKLKIPAVLLSSAVLIHMCLLRKDIRKRFLYKSEKSVRLTDKRNAGLIAAVFMLLGLGLGMLIKGGGNTGSAYAKEKEEMLWTELRDDSERKLLIKDEGVFKVNDRVRLEIPANALPDGSFTILLTALADDGTRYVSREYRIRK